MWQSEFVQGELRRLFPSCAVEILAMSTRGDEILDVSLAKVGGKGLFVKELESAVAEVTETMTLRVLLSRRI